MNATPEKRFLARAFPPRSIKTLVLSFLSSCVFYSFYLLSHLEYASYNPNYLYNQLATYFEAGVYNNTLYQNGTEAAVHAHWNFSQPCQGFPNTEDIMVVMKTGATEAFEKMPTQLLTSLQCLPDFLLFSDLEQQIGKYHIYNVLDRVENIMTSQRREFVLYQAQQSCPISQKECTKGMVGGWDLDKYKFMNMVVRTWEMRPDRKWYVFVEADTYVVWSNLIQWLDTRMDATDDVYVGGIAYLGTLPFAHGGTGYVISGVLLKRLVSLVNQASAAQFDEIATRLCCGDALLANAFDNIEVSVQKASPMFNGEKPNTLAFGPHDWCQPLFTMHHMNSEEISAVWQYEQTRTKTDPLQIRDIYHAFVGPNLISRRSQWNNRAEQTCFENAGDGNNVIEHHAHQSPDACSRVCIAKGLDIDAAAYEMLGTEEERDAYLENTYNREADKGGVLVERKCFQWRYYKGKCCVSDTFSMGYPSSKYDEGDITSGWFVEGIEEWIDEFGQCDEGTKWVEAECIGKWCSTMKQKQKARKLAKQTGGLVVGEDGDDLR